VSHLRTTQFGNDLEDLAINGDTTSSNKTLKIFNGWYKLALAGAHVVDAGGAQLDLPIFNKALKAMPRTYMQKRVGLKFYTGSNSIQDYLYSQAQQGNGAWSGPRSDRIIDGGPVRTEGANGFIAGRPFGVTLQEVPLFLESETASYSGGTGDHGHVELTFPQNRVMGIKREVQVFREFQPKKDAIEYTTYIRAGVNWENLDACVIVKSVKLAA
jgi:hypothetical protein